MNESYFRRFFALLAVAILAWSQVSQSETIELTSISREVFEEEYEWHHVWPLPPGESTVNLGTIPRGAVVRIKLRPTNADARVTVSAGRHDVATHEAPANSWTSLEIDVGGRVLQTCRVAFECEGAMALATIDLTKENPDRPNVLIFLIDTLRADHTSVYGYDNPTTPNLEKFAEKCVVFEHAMAQSSWTRPSIATLLSSLYPEIHGARDLPDKMTPGLATLQTALGDAGYDTRGVSINAQCHPDFRVCAAFDSFRLYYHGQGDAMVIDRAIEDIDHADPNPWFMYVHTMGPHRPYWFQEGYTEQFYEPLRWKSPDEMRAFLEQAWVDGFELTDQFFGTVGWKMPAAERPADRKSFDDATLDDIHEWAVAHYDGEIAHTDAEFGRLVAALRERGTYDDTLIIVTADHGEEFWEHGGIGHGYTLYNEQLHVPLMVKLPKHDAGAKRLDALVELRDITPTILEVAGLDSDGFEGRSLLGYMRGEAFDERPGYASLRFREFSMRTARDGSVKFLEDLATGKAAWYDLEADPGELSPLSTPPEGKEYLAAIPESIEMRGDSGLNILITEAFGETVHIEGTVGGKGLAVQNIVSLEEKGSARVENDSAAFAINVDDPIDYVRANVAHRGGAERASDHAKRLMAAHAQRILHLTLDVDASEPITIHLRRNGEPIAGDLVKIGSEMQSSTFEEMTLNLNDIKASPTLFDPKRLKPGPAVYVWYVESGPADRLEDMDPKIREELDALGYF